MIYILDDFIPKNLFDLATSYLKKGKYQKIKAGEKNFYIQESPKSFTNFILTKLSIIEQKPLENILSFFRVSNDNLDTQWRIHSDLIINQQKPDRAAVLYMSPREREELHGTAFWEHDIYGKKLPHHVTEDEYNKMIELDSEQLEKWRLVSVVGYEQNRIISYPANYFHSKYPNMSWKEGRQVYVMFYKYKK